MDELVIGGRQYVSSKRAAEITGYAKDYIGQLCRAKRIDGKLVGRNWYVEPRSLLHLSVKKPGSSNSESSLISDIREVRNPNLLEESTFAYEPENVSYEVDSTPLVPVLRSESNVVPLKKRKEDEGISTETEMEAYSPVHTKDRYQEGLEEAGPEQETAVQTRVPAKPSRNAVDLRVAGLINEVARRRKEDAEQARVVEGVVETRSAPASMRRKAFSMPSISYGPVLALGLVTASIVILVGGIFNRERSYPSKVVSYSMASYSDLSASAIGGIKNLGKTR